MTLNDQDIAINKNASRLKNPKVDGYDFEFWPSY